MEVSGQPMKFVKIHNPWGQGEYTGRFNEKSPEFATLCVGGKITQLLPEFKGGADAMPAAQAQIPCKDKNDGSICC